MLEDATQAVWIAHIGQLIAEPGSRPPEVAREAEEGMLVVVEQHQAGRVDLDQGLGERRSDAARGAREQDAAIVDKLRQARHRGRKLRTSKQELGRRPRTGRGQARTSRMRRRAARIWTASSLWDSIGSVTMWRA